MSLDNWNDYTGKNWLKSEDVTDDNQAFVCINVEISENERPLLKLERETNSYLMELNVTNSIKAKEFVAAPKELLGKKLYFKKVAGTNPQTKQIVDTLRIYNIV